MTDSDEKPAQQMTLNPIVVIGWFGKHTELRSVTPNTAMRSDVWVVLEQDSTTITDNVVAMAVVEDGELHRLGVKPGHRREGLGTRIVEQLHDEYGRLAAECRKSLDANDFYEATGWELDGTVWGDPEDLHLWVYE